jgi:hypothetical protein
MSDDEILGLTDELADDPSDDESTLWVVTGEMTRRTGAQRLRAEDLSVNINLFLSQMGDVLNRTPAQLGMFQFVEFEIHAEITGKGTLAILGTGGEIGASGGVKFVFRRRDG